jgi:hypothetical protein
VFRSRAGQARSFPRIWKIVIKSGVNHTIRFGGSTSQALQVFKAASMHLGASSHERLGACIGARQADHLMARIN